MDAARWDGTYRFAALHRGEKPLLLPNAWDYASAAALAAAGFPAVGTTSLGVAAAHGLPDAEGRARAETVALAHSLARLPCLVTVDLEAGFSDDPGEVADLAAELAEAGIVGINLEDSRPDGLANPGSQAALISAVRHRVPALFLNARVDTHWLTTDPPPLADTLARARRYVDAGADGIFVPGLAAETDVATVVGSLAVPVNLLATPYTSVDRLTQLGVRRISTGSLLFRVALHNAVTTARRLRDGTASGDVPGYGDIQRLIGG